MIASVSKTYPPLAGGPSRLVPSEVSLGSVPPLMCPRTDPFDSLRFVSLFVVFQFTHALQDLAGVAIAGVDAVQFIG